MAFCLNKSDKTVKSFIDRVGEKQASAIAEMINQEVPIMIVNDKGELVQSQLFKSLLAETNGDYQEAFNKYLISEFGEVDVADQIDETSEELDKELDSKLKAFLSEHGITVKAYETLKGKVDGDPVAAADIINKTVLINEGKADITTLPEETAHFAIELLGDSNPLVMRLMNTITMFPEYQEVVDEYSEIYKNDPEKIRKEAVGKVLSKYIIKQSEDNITNSRKNLLQRIWDSFMRVINSIPPKSLKEMSDDIYQGIAKDVLKNDLNEADVKNLSKSRVDVLFSKETDKALTRYEKSLTNIIATEVKRLKIFYTRANDKFSTKEKNLIKELNKSLQDNQAEQGIIVYLKNAKEEFKKVDARLRSLKEESKDLESTNVMNLVKAYRDMRKYIQAFEPVIDELITEVNADPELDRRVKALYKKALREFKGTIEDANNDYFEVGVPLVSNFLEPFLGERGVVPFGPDKGKKFDIGAALKNSKQDISFWDKWFDSMAESSDEVLSLIDIAVKQSKSDSDDATLKIHKEILQAKIDLEKAGYKDDSFMYEKSTNGRMSKYYISKYNMTEFEEARRKFFNKMGNRVDYKGGEKSWDIQVAKWYQENVREDDTFSKGYRPANKYLNNDFGNLSKEQKAYYDKYMGILNDLRNKLPEKYRDPLRVIMLRKNLVERVRNAGKQGGLRSVGEAVSEGFIRKEDEDQYGVSFKITNFDGKELSFLPIYYSNDIKNADDISTDSVFTLSSFASMANDYAEMSKVVDVLEMAKDVVGNRKTEIVEAGKTKKESLSGIAGEMSRALTKDGEATNTYARLESYYDMVVYGKTKKDEGQLFGTKLDQAKTIDALGKYTAINSLALNVFAGVANINLGKAMMRIEALAGEYVKYKSLLKADKIYGKELMNPTNGVIANIGKRNSNNKLDLWAEKFRTMQDYRQSIREIDTKLKTQVGSLVNLSSLFFINKCGEHYMQNRMSLAIANEIKLKDADGNIINLWDAYEVKGNTLVLKDGITKEDGSEWTSKDEFKFRNKNAFINNRLHGIYNDVDKSAIQQYSLGRLGIMFRKYLRPGLNRRFKKMQYNYEGEVWTEGYYRTTGRFMNILIQDLKQQKFAITAHWDELTGVEKANLKRSLGDTIYLIGSMALSSILANISGDDDDEWIANMMAYQSNRLFTEIGAMTPSPLIISEGFRIVKAPMAAITTTQDIESFLEFWHWGERIEQGKYKGQSKFYRSGLRLIKPLKGLEDLANPEQKLKFFN